MAERILTVTAFTTLDLVDARVEGHGWESETYAVCNVTTDDGDGDGGDERVVLQVELDNTDLAHLDAHADELRLTPAEARELAATLEERAADIDDGDE